MPEARHDKRCSIGKSCRGQLGGTVSVLNVPTDDESRSLDAPKVFGVVGGIRPALELEREHLGGRRGKVVYQPVWGGLRFACGHPLYICADPDLTDIGRKLATPVVRDIWVGDYTDADDRVDTRSVYDYEHIN